MFCVDQRVKLSGGWIGAGVTPGLQGRVYCTVLRRSMESNRAVKELSGSFTVPGEDA